jgi:nucleotide-binding universal stress UspA family protein
VVAYDVSTEAQDALREAVALFGHRPLLVVSVWETGLATMMVVPAPGEVGPSYLPDPADVAAVDRARSDHAANAAEAGAHMARELGATVEAIAVRDSADVAATLAEIAEQRDAAAIVVGSRGLGAVKARVLGSTSRKLLAHARRPVLVVRRP